MPWMRQHKHQSAPWWNGRFKKKRSPIHRKITGWAHHKNSYGCREWSPWINIFSVAGAGWWREKWSAFTAKLGAWFTQNPPCNGSCEGKDTRKIVEESGFEPVVPPKSNRLKPWFYDKTIYKRPNEIERLFRRLKGFRRIFSRFEKLDRMFSACVHIALTMEMIKNINSP